TVLGELRRVVVLVEHSVAKPERGFVVDLHEDDGAVWIAEGTQLGTDRLVPAPRFFLELRARVAREGERQRWNRQHHSGAARGTSHALLVPEHAFRDAESGQLGVDVRTRPHDRV